LISLAFLMSFGASAETADVGVSVGAAMPPVDVA